MGHKLAEYYFLAGNWLNPCCDHPWYYTNRAQILLP